MIPGQRRPEKCELNIEGFDPAHKGQKHLFSQKMLIYKGFGLYQLI